MQTQQQKPAQPSPPKTQRLSIGEIVVAVLNQLIGGIGAWSAFDLLIHVVDSPAYLLPGGTGALGAVGALLAGILILLRQRRLATYAQWLGALGALAMFGAIAWIMLKTPTQWREYLFALPLLVVALIFAWFAWFLKRIDESE